MQEIDKSKLASKVKRLGHLNIPGGGQVVVHGKYAYIGHMDPPHGTTILDISNPADPKIVSQITLPDGYSHTHKVRVVGDLMFTNYEQYNRHFLRKGDSLPAIREKLAADLGRTPTDEEVAAEAGVKPDQVATLDQARERGYHDGGFCIYDISDRANPKRLCHKKTYGFGVHRFDVDENYAYMSTEMEGYIGNILVVYDYSDPTDPKEVSRWWMPGQHLAGGEKPTWKGYHNRLHHAMRVGDEFWASCWHAGLKVLDASDIRNIKTVGEYDYHPPIPEPTHTVMPLEQTIDGKRIAVVVDEEHSGKAPGQLHGFMWTFDVTDLKDIKPLAIWDLSEMDSPYSRAGGRFGAHQYREKLDSTLVYLTWFSGGLRIVDVANPSKPIEVGFYIPEPINGFLSPQSNDVDVDENGLVYLLDRNAGLDILEFTP